jgi:hypothetical protein
VEVTAKTVQTSCHRKLYTDQLNCQFTRRKYRLMATFDKDKALAHYHELMKLIHVDAHRGVLIGGILAALSLIALCSACGGGTNPPIRDTPTNGVGCVAPADTHMQDVARRDSKETPFSKAGSGPLTVYFENVNLSASLWSELQQAAEIWSRSPCVKAIAVAQCPPSSNCVQVGQYYSGEGQTGRALDRHSDGAFMGEESDGCRTGGVIDLNLDLINEETPQGSLATIVHEMGHAFGLQHRKNKTDVMNARTTDNTSPIPDKVDFDNLCALYGK